MTRLTNDNERRKSVVDIIAMLKPCTRMTQKEVAAILNVTRPRIGQIERQAIWKVQQRLNEVLKGNV